jgi:alpha-2-macroglobulin
MRRLLALILAMSLSTPAALAAYDSADKPLRAELSVLRGVPVGAEVPNPLRQIVVTFDRIVVPIGNMQVAADQAPVTVEPAAKCHWHWLDPRSLACELDQDAALTPATAYRVTVREGLHAEDGTVLRVPFIWEFTTERPAVRQYGFKTWSSPGTPVVRLVFNQPVTKDSVEASLKFGALNIEATPDPSSREVYYVLPMPHEGKALVFPSGTEALKSDAQTTTVAQPDGTKIEARRVWLVAPVAEIAKDSSVALTVSPGLRGAQGPLRGVESRTVVEVDAFPEFRFLGLRCSVGADRVLLAPASTDTEKARCNPFNPIELVFSAPVISLEVKAHLQLKPDLAAGRTDYDPWANVYAYSWLSSPHRRDQDYAIQLPERLRAFQSYPIAGLTALHDEFDRPLRGPGSMQFHTAHRVPKLKLTHPIAVLEKNVPTTMPLYVTNLTDIDVHYSRLTPTGAQHDLRTQQPIQRVWDQSYAVPAKIRELLGGQSGVVSGSLYAHPGPGSVARSDSETDEESDPGLPNAHPDQDFLAEVTPFQIHAKLGQYNTLVWVTRLSDGKAVPGASVRMYMDTYKLLSDAPTVLSEAKTGPDGVALLLGRRALDVDLAHRYDHAASETPTLMVRVDEGGDMALLPLDDPFAIDTYRSSRGQFWSAATNRDHVRAWGATAQGVYKLGDTIDFKLYVRNVDNRSLEPVVERRGYTLKVIDPTGKAVYERSDVDLSEFGSYSDSFRVPPSAAVGWYQFLLTSPNLAPDAPAASRAQAGQWAPMRVLVADFTPAPFQVHNTLNGNLFAPGDSVEVDTQATLHAGGPYASAESRVTARIWPAEIEIKTAAAAGFAFDRIESAGDCGPSRQPEVETVHQSADTISGQGELTTRFQMPDSQILAGRLEIESAVRDERGKYVASRVSADFRGRERYVGLRSEHWTFEEGKPASVQYIVVGKDGRIAAGTPVAVSIHREIVSAARVKGAGSAYLTAFDRRWESQTGCTGLSGDAGRPCTFTPDGPGLYSIEASVTDTKGRTHTTQLCTWVTGKGQVMWQEPEDMSLSLVPEKSSYQVGDRAQILVRNPFPGATALVTVERYGVIKSWVQTLPGNTPIIRFQVEPDFLPGFYLSVVVISPRVAPAPGMDATGEGGVDLGRPTYRIGYARINVQDPYKALEVKVRSDHAVYKPRDTVKLDISAAPHALREARQPVEFAVAVLDESVFDLIQDGKNYFDPYKGFYELEPLDLENFGLLTRLVGLQKFEKKGANAGGDGGAGFDMRTVSKYLAYWNPSVIGNRAGHAKLEFTLPDNLTGWRVFVIATTPTDHLGLGDYRFKSSKSTELRPVMPNQLTQGDRFTAGFSVLNRADRVRTIAVSLHATGPIEGGTQTLQQTLTLAPFKRETVWLPLKTLADGIVHLSARAGDAADGDALNVGIAVHKRVSLQVAASYGTTVNEQVAEPLLYPASMQPNIGDLSVLLSPSVIGNLGGSFRYAKEYPYECWEQRLTRALLAANFLRLQSHLPPDVAWPEAAALPQAVLDDAASFQAPNGGMGFWLPNDDRVSPYLSAATALAFHQLRVAGYRVPSDVEQHLLGYLDRLLRENVAPTFYSEGMVSSVRAVALEALALDGTLKREDLARYEKFAPQMDLFGLAAYLQAAVSTSRSEPLAASLAQRILSHANQSGGQFHFTETWDDGYAQLLATPLRSECAILSAFLRYAETSAGAPLVGDIPFKLVRTITQSQGDRDHWPNTQENLYCAQALAEYSDIYEKAAPALSATVSLGEQRLGEARFSSFQDPPARLSRPNGAADAGRRAQVTIERHGDGRIYYATHLSYAPKDAAAAEVNAGLEIHREYSVQRDGAWQLLGSPAEVHRGELVRVDLYVALPAARHFVVVDDPVPGGLEPVNRQLATASTVDAASAEFQAAGGSFWFHFGDWGEFGFEGYSFYHQELRHESARFYADYLAAGHYHLSYAAQAIAEGEFLAPPARAAEMYDPDVYGLGLPGMLDVGHD